MRFGNDHPRFGLVETWIPVDEVTWIWHSDGWHDSNEWLTLFEGVDPCDIVDPLLIFFVELVSVVLAREAIVVRVHTFNDPPFAFNCGDVSQVSLSTGGVDSTCHVIWIFVSAFICVKALSKNCEIFDTSSLSIFNLTIKLRSWLGKIRLQYAR